MRSASACLSCLAALTASGCWLPVVLTERGSPIVVGRYWRPNGTPAVGARVAVTSHSKDGTCARALERGTTDSMGVFQLRATTVRRRGIWLIPAIERFGNAYWLCAGQSDTGLQMAYGGGVSFVVRGIPTDSVTCLEWSWHDRTRVTCAGPDEKRALQTGGSWSEGGATGFYRLIVVEAGWDAREPGVFLQWVQRSDTGVGETVRETVALPLVAGLLEIEEVWFWMPRGRPVCVTVDSRGRPRSWWRDQTRERVAFELGPPGQMRRLATC